MSISCLAMCSSSAPAPAPSMAALDATWPLYSISNMLGRDISD